MRTGKKYAFKSPLKCLAVSLLDTAGDLLKRGAHFFLRTGVESLVPEPSKILLVRLDHIGDVVMTRSAVRALKDRYPRARIDWLVPAETCDLLAGDAFVDRLIGFSNHWLRRGRSPAGGWREFWSLVSRLRAEGYDAAVEFRGDLRSLILIFLARIPARIGYGITGGRFLLTQCLGYDWSAHQVKLSAALVSVLGAESASANLPLLTQPDLFSGEIPPKDDASRRVVIHPGAGYASKLWPSENFAYLISGLRGIPGVEIVLIGTALEKSGFPVDAAASPQRGRVIDCRGSLALGQLPALMQTAELFIGGDSGPAHIAAAQGIMVISIFSGANDPELWKPWTPNLLLMTHSTDCSPCGLSVCRVPGHPCMTGIRREEVLAAARRYLEGKPVS